jgi:tRNA pseudouridine13 synthase
MNVGVTWCVSDVGLVLCCSLAQSAQLLNRENRDTMAALSTLSRMLHLTSKSFYFAGTKDKRGQTTQVMSLNFEPSSQCALQQL